MTWASDGCPQTERSSRSLWRDWLLHSARENRFVLSLTGVSALGSAAFGAIGAWLMIPLSALLFPAVEPFANAGPLNAGGIAGGALALFEFVAGGITPLSVASALLVVFAAKNACEYGARIGSDYLGIRTEETLRRSLWSAYWKSTRRQCRTDSGDRSVHELLVGSSEAAASVAAIPTRWFGDPLAAITFLGTMAIVHPALTFGLAAILPPCAWLVRRGFARVGYLADRRFVARVRLGTWLGEIARFRNVLTTHAAQGWAASTSAPLERSVVRAATIWSRRIRAIPAGAETLGAAAGAGTVFFLGGRIGAGGLGGAAFLTFLTAFFLLLPVLKRLAALSGDLRTSRAAWLRLAALAPEENRGTVRLPASQLARPPRIELRGICVRGREGGAVLSIDGLEILPGEITIVTGETGAGKSLLLETAACLAVPDAGEVRWNGIVIHSSTVSPDSLPLGYVPQDGWAIAGTVADNVALGRSVSASRISAVLGCVGLSLDPSMVLGDGGTPLSGGERQRLALARALLLRPPFLILDEPTSALDAETEQAIARCILSARGDATILIATHRPAIAAFADHTISVRAGRVVSAALEVRAV